MTHYFHGLDTNDTGENGLPHHLANASRQLGGIVQFGQVVGAMDDAERRLIECRVTPSRREGAIAFFTAPATGGCLEPIKGRSVFITARRFADEWRVIDFSATISTGFDDEDDASRVIIGLPPEDLKAIRAGGDDLEDFAIYVEMHAVSLEGTPVRLNGAMPHRFHELRPTRDYIDAWEPMSAAERAEFAAAMAEHQAILEIRD